MGGHTQRMCPAERNPSPGVLDRVSELFAAFDEDTQRLTLSELARRAEIPKSTVHRLVNHLARLGLLEVRDGQIQLGIRLFELGELVPRRRTLADAAAPHMIDLRDATGRTVHLAVLDGQDVVYVHITPGRTGPRMPSRIGGRLPVHATGVGKAILAFSPAATVQPIVEGPLPPMSPYTITLPGALGRELVSIRSSGVAYDREESTVGISCVAAPVLGPHGYAIAALSVSGTTAGTDVARLGPAVQTAALALSRAIARPSLSIDTP